MAGARLVQLRDEGLLPARAWGDEALGYVAVKEAVLPFRRSTGTDARRGPEMRSTGEVMGIDTTFGAAFAKAELAAGVGLPATGTAFVSVCDRDKRSVVFPAKRLAELGFRILATRGTARVLERAGIQAEVVPKASERSDGARDVVARIAAGDVDIVFNTPFGERARSDGCLIRTAAVGAGVACCTTMTGMAAAVLAIEALGRGDAQVRSLQERVGQGAFEPIP